MKAYKVTILCVDFEDHGIESIIGDLHVGQLLAITEIDIGEWYDNHPFNKRITEAEVNAFIEQKGNSLNETTQKIYDKLTTELKDNKHSVWFENDEVEFEILSAKPLTKEIVELEGTEMKIQVYLEKVVSCLKLVTYTIKPFNS